MRHSRYLQKGYSEEGSAVGAGGEDVGGSATLAAHARSAAGGLKQESLDKESGGGLTGRGKSLDTSTAAAATLAAAAGGGVQEDNFVPILHDHFFCNRVVLNISGLA